MVKVKTTMKTKLNVLERKRKKCNVFFLFPFFYGVESRVLYRLYGAKAKMHSTLKEKRFNTKPPPQIEEYAFCSCSVFDFLHLP